MKTPQSTRHRERVLLIGVERKHPPHVPGLAGRGSERQGLAELEELARSAGAEVVATIFQQRESLDPATLLGRGKLEEIRAEAHARDVPLLIFDRNLTPVQQRNIERATECRVIDRTQLILDIFARHARSREGQLQVELAQLTYLLPRLAGRGSELSRLGAGIGTRGPGEQKLETDRRRIRDRIRRIRESIEKIRRQRSLHRRARQAVPLGTVALVGYTNAGKSTLFNALTHADVLVSPRLFATLDPTLRVIRLPSNRRVLLSDTVGFIRDLPPGLIAAFRATLEEVQQAAVLVHVSDISNPRHAEQDVEVEKVLAELGVADRPRLRVFNKIDQLSEADRAALHRDNGNLYISALHGIGLDALLQRLDEVLPVDPLVHLSLRLAVSDGRTLALVHALGRVLRSEIHDGFLRLEAEVPTSLARRLQNSAASQLAESWAPRSGGTN
ncbi:MAG: GTPase HflX [Firmicutes bacterium]|nr:GTPase HflX [Bacillota bacterium]